MVVMSHTRSCRAFTLVELSMVLVVIALLTGGIIGMRTYTRNAEISTMFNEAKLLINAFNQFQTRYGAPPGDYATASDAWNAASDGDGNGLIRADALNAPNGNRVELFYSFEHLALAGFIQGVYTGATVGGGGTYDAQIGTNVAGSRKERYAFLFDNPDYDDGTPDGFILNTNTHPIFFEGQYSNSLRVAGHNNVQGDSAGEAGLPDTGFLTPTQMLNLDEKYDDGYPGKGSVVTPRLAGLADCATTNDPTTAVYDTAKTDKTCWFLIKIQ